MCGIAGIVTQKPGPLGDPLKAMLKTMQHRGPDGAGVMLRGAVQRKPTLEALNFEEGWGTIALGHVRLSITGGSRGFSCFFERRAAVPSP